MADKITKKDMYALVREIVANTDCDSKEDLLGFLDHEVEMISNKAAKAAARAAERRAESDELKATVLAVLTDSLQTADAITAQIEGEDVTKSKVVARLSALVKAGLAAKEQVKVDSRKVMAYKLQSDEDEADAE